jgi:hypothetical protein
VGRCRRLSVSGAVVRGSRLCLRSVEVAEPSSRAHERRFSSGAAHWCHRLQIVANGSRCSATVRSSVRAGGDRRGGEQNAPGRTVQLQSPPCMPPGRRGLDISDRRPRGGNQLEFVRTGKNLLLVPARRDGRELMATVSAGRRRRPLPASGHCQCPGSAAGHFGRPRPVPSKASTCLRPSRPARQGSTPILFRGGRWRPYLGRRGSEVGIRGARCARSGRFTSQLRGAGTRAREV